MLPGSLGALGRSMCGPLVLLILVVGLKDDDQLLCERFVQQHRGENCMRGFPGSRATGLSR